MTQKGVLWNGKYYTSPGAASRIDSSALARTPLGGANVLAILGIATGLFPPKTLQGLSDPSLALNLLDPATSEEARLATQLAFDPAPGVQGASQVYFVAVNPSTAAAITLSSAVTLTSYLFGISANQVMVKVESGTTAGKKVSVQFGANAAEVYDNLSRSSFSIVYTGSGSAATMTITPTAATHSLTTSCTGASGDNLALDLSAYSTVQALVAAINATGKYTAIVTASNPAASTMQLDGVTTQDIKTATFTAHSDLQAVVDGINKSSSYVSAVKVADAVAAPANAAWAYLSGGANGTATNNDWQAAFDLLKTMEVNFTCVLSSDASIHAMNSAHLSYMSGSDGKSERRGFIGGALQSWTSEVNRSAAIAALLTAAGNLNDDRLVYAGLGSYFYDPNGDLKLYPGYISAAAYAGMAAGGRPTEPLTHKAVACKGLEVALRPNEKTQLIDGGICCLIADNDAGSGYIIDRQVTTWNRDANLYRIEFSVGNGADYVAVQVRKRHAKVIGQEGSEGMDTTLINLTNGVLEAALQAGYIRSYDPKATVLRVDNTIRYIDYSAQPILPISFIFSTYHLLPTVQTITL